MKMRKGIAVQGMVITLAIVAILLLITGLVYGYVRDAMNAPMSSLGSTAYNATVANIDSNTYSSLDLASVTPIVLAAVLVIGVVLLLRKG
jgi:hypothetical protein